MLMRVRGLKLFCPIDHVLRFPGPPLVSIYSSMKDLPTY